MGADRLNRTFNEFNYDAFINETGSSSTDKAFTTISFGLGCLIIFINVPTLIFLFRHKKYVGGIGFWQQLLFLCLTDLLSGTAVFVFKFGYFFMRVHSSIYYSICVLGLFLYPISITLSAGNCFLISLQRYIYIKKISQPFTFWHKYATSFMISINIFVCILTIVSSVIVVNIHFGFHPLEFCNMINKSGQNEYKSKYIMGTVIMLVVFLLCTNILAVLSIIKVKKGARVQPTGSCTSINNSVFQSSNSFHTQMKRNQYATTTFILIVLVLNLTSLPSLLFLLVSIFNNITVSPEITEVISRLMTVNSLFNPFVYSLRMSNFRNAIWKDIKTIWNRLKCIRSN